MHDFHIDSGILNGVALCGIALRIPNDSKCNAGIRCANVRQRGLRGSIPSLHASALTARTVGIGTLPGRILGAAPKTPMPILLLGILLRRPPLLAGKFRCFLLGVALPPGRKRLRPNGFLRLVPLVLSPKSRLAGLDFFMRKTRRPEP